MTNCRVKNQEIHFIEGVKERIQPGIIEKGKINDISRLSESLYNLIKKSSEKPANILFSPAAGEVLVRTIKIPNMPEDEVREALYWEVEDYLPFSADDAAFDYTVINTDEEGQLEVLLVVLPRKVLNNYNKVFQKAGISAQVANTQELALSSLLLNQGKLKEATLILNMGAVSTQIIILSQEEFFLSRMVEIGGNDFTEVFKSPENSFWEAEKYKKEYSIENTELKEEQLQLDKILNGSQESLNFNEGIKSLIRDLSKEINRSLSFYSNRHRGDNINKAFYTGGGFLLKGLISKLEDEINIKLNPINPFENITIEENTLDKAVEYFSVSLGLVVSEVIDDES